MVGLDCSFDDLTPHNVLAKSSLSKDAKRAFSLWRQSANSKYLDYKLKKEYNLLSSICLFIDSSIVDSLVIFTYKVN